MYLRELRGRRVLRRRRQVGDRAEDVRLERGLGAERRQVRRPRMLQGRHRLRGVELAALGRYVPAKHCQITASPAQLHNINIHIIRSSRL